MVWYGILEFYVPLNRTRLSEGRKKKYINIFGSFTELFNYCCYKGQQNKPNALQYRFTAVIKQLSVHLAPTKTMFLHGKNTSPLFSVNSFLIS